MFTPECQYAVYIKKVLIVMQKNTVSTYDKATLKKVKLAELYKKITFVFKKKVLRR